jgi:hypothetical protein
MKSRRTLSNGEFATPMPKLSHFDVSSLDREGAAGPKWPRSRGNTSPYIAENVEMTSTSKQSTLVGQKMANVTSISSKTKPGDPVRKLKSVISRQLGSSGMPSTSTIYDETSGSDDEILPRILFLKPSSRKKVDSDFRLSPMTASAKRENDGQDIREDCLMNDKLQLTLNFRVPEVSHVESPLSLEDIMECVHILS